MLRHWNLTKTNCIKMVLNNELKRRLVTCPRRPFSYCQAPKVETAAVEQMNCCRVVDGGASAMCWTVASDGRRIAAAEMCQLHSHCCDSSKKMALIDCRGMPVSRHRDCWWFIQRKCHVPTGCSGGGGQWHFDSRIVGQQIGNGFLLLVAIVD